MLTINCKIATWIGVMGCLLTPVFLNALSCQSAFRVNIDFRVGRLAASDNRVIAVEHSYDTGRAYSYQPQTGWQPLSGFPEGTHFYNVFRAGNYFFLSFNLGELAASEDGLTWRMLDLPFKSVYPVVWTGSEYLALAGQRQLFSSSDGLNWVEEALPIQNNLQDLIIAGQKVLILAKGQIMLLRNPDKTWQLQNITGAVSIDQLYWNGAMFISYSISGSQYYASLDGFTWDEIELPEHWHLFPDRLHQAWLIINPDRTISSSADARTWTPSNITSPMRSRFDPLVDFITDTGDRIWVGNEYLVSALSLETQEWQSFTPGIKDVHDLFWTGGEFVAYGQGLFNTSKDGRIWNQPTEILLSDLVYTGDRFVGVYGFPSKTFGSGRVYSSVDGHQWESVDIGMLQTFDSIAWSGQRFVIGGTILSFSQDGETWTPVDPPLPGRPGPVLWTGEAFLVLSDQKVFVSKDGETWNSVAIVGKSDSQATSYQSLAIGPDRMVSWGSSGISTSPNGIVWDPAFLPIYNFGNIMGGIWSDGQYRIFTENAELISSDGIIWTSSLPKNMPMIQRVSNDQTSLFSNFSGLYWGCPSEPVPEPEPELSAIVPWIVNNQNWSSRISLFNPDEVDHEIKLLSINQSRETREKRVVIPATALDTMLASELFDDFSGYSLFLYGSRKVQCSYLTFNQEESSGGHSPSQTRAAGFREMTGASIFPYLPGDQIPAVVIVSAEKGQTWVEISLLNTEGIQYQSVSKLLDSQRPYAFLVSELFPVMEVSEGASISVVSNNGARVTGTTFIFNHQRQPSMSTALPANGL